MCFGPSKLYAKKEGATEAVLDLVLWRRLPQGSNRLSLFFLELAGVGRVGRFYWIQDIQSGEEVNYFIGNLTISLSTNFTIQSLSWSYSFFESVFFALWSKVFTAKLDAEVAYAWECGFFILSFIRSRIAVSPWELKKYMNVMRVCRSLKNSHDCDNFFIASASAFSYRVEICLMIRGIRFFVRPTADISTTWWTRSLKSFFISW